MEVQQIVIIILEMFIIIIYEVYFVCAVFRGHGVSWITLEWRRWISCWAVLCSPFFLALDLVVMFIAPVLVLVMFNSVGVRGERMVGKLYRYSG